MLPIKILCACGQKYAFDVEPVNGRMPHAVNCPVCGADGTATANEIIARSLPPPRPAADPNAFDAAPPVPALAHNGPEMKRGLLVPVLVGVLIFMLALGGVLVWKYVYHHPLATTVVAHSDLASSRQTTEADQGTTSRDISSTTSTTTRPNQPASVAAETDAPIGGIGVQLDSTNGVLRAAGVLAYGPAEAAGVEVGSRIVSINGDSTANLTLEEAAGRLRGAVGTTVDIETVLPDGTHRSFSLTRLAIPEIMQEQYAIRSRKLDEATEVLVIRLFGTNTPDALASALADFQSNGGRHVILDVRNNPGGSASDVADVAGQFIGKRVPLWQSRRVANTNVQVAFSSRIKVWRGDVIVLVDGRTCSGAELFASAFQTSGRAKIWGRTTAGAATFYNLEHEPNGEKKIVPAGEFLTAKGEPLQGRGVTPDVMMAKLADEELFAKILAAQQASGAEREKQVAQLPPVAAFINFKAQQAIDIAQTNGFDLPPDFKSFFAAAAAGHLREADQLLESIKKNAADTNPPPALKSSLPQLAVDVALAYQPFNDADADMVMALGHDLMDSLPAGCIYFGGTDAGRGLPTLLCKAPGDPVYVLTQNALDDGRYLRYVREMYGSGIQLPATNEVRDISDAFTADTQRRWRHDRDFPNEPKQLHPGEGVQMIDGKPILQGVASIMGLSARIAKAIFDRNPDREFYLEQSFPLDWMYPYLSPHGPILKLNRQPLATISDEDVSADTAYWSAKIKALTGNPKFDGGGYVGKTYAHLRSAIAGLYAWRAQSAKDAAERQRMFQAAEPAYRQALSLDLTMPEAVFGMVNLELAQGRADTALMVANNALAADPSSEQIKSLVANLQSYLKSRAPASAAVKPDQSPDPQQQLKDLKAQLDQGKIDQQEYEQKKQAILNAL